MLASLLLLATFAPGAAAATPNGADWIEATYRFRFSTLTELEATGDVDLRRITLGDTRYDADELRDAYRALVATRGQAAGTDFLDAVETALADSFRANLEAAFPGAEISDPVADLDAATLEVATAGDPTDPPVTLTLVSSIVTDIGALGIQGVTEDDIDALLDVGATIDVPITFFADPGHDNAFVVAFGDGYVLKDLLGTRIAQVHGAVDNSFGSTPSAQQDTFRIASADAPAPSPTRGRIEVTVDIMDLDVTIAGAAGGDFGSMAIDVAGDAALEAFAIPEDTASAFPEGVHISSLTSGGIRSLVARGLLDRGALDDAGGKLVDTLRDRLAGLGVDPEDVTGGFDAASIDATGDTPLVFRVHAKLTRPLSGGAAPSGAAIALYSVTQSLPFERIEGLDTVYHLILPPGLAATSATTTGGDVKTVHRDDGRDEVQLALTGDDAPDRATMKVQIAVTPSFVFAKFWPIVMLVILVVVLVIGGVTWGVVRAVRKKK